jgi:gamma-glutamylcyclotransferase (GGCT)/AIG2-like uncharacterized protein YtfP
MKLFVYGTLMRGLAWHSLIKNRGAFQGLATLPDHALMLLQGGNHPIPALVKAESGSLVLGEVYEVSPNDLLYIFDPFESGAEYTRVKVRVVVEGDSKPVEAQAYLYGLSTKGMKRIGMDFRSYLQEIVNDRQNTQS